MFLAAFVILWSTLLLLFGPEGIVRVIGAQHSLWITFFVASLGGVSTFTATSFYTTIVTFASGGVNPLYLGIVGGIGITVGDSFFYYLGKTGASALSGKPGKLVKEFSTWMQSKPAWIVSLVTFLYAGLTPLPNDILTVTLGVSQYKYRFIILPLLLANIFLTTLVAFVVAGVFA